MAPLWGSGNEVKESTLRSEDEDESEEDYMTMVIPDVQGPESSLQRRRREAREVSSSSESIKLAVKLRCSARARSEVA